MKTKPNKRLIVVLGMHRSGTSAITRALNVFGVALGDNLMPAVVGDNDKGYFEDVDLNALNVEMLNAIGSNWSDLSLIESYDVDELCKKGYFLKALDLLRYKTSANPVFGFKDPRVAKLMPFWSKVFAHTDLAIAYVISVRNPLSVTQSLSKRGALSSEESYILWLSHVLNSLVYTQDSTRVLVDYDQFMDSPKSVLTTISKRLDLHFDQQAWEEYQGNFLTNDLRHSRFEAKDLMLDINCPPIARDLYTTVLEVAYSRQLDNADFSEFITNCYQEVERFKLTFKVIDKLSRQIFNLNQFQNFFKS